MREENKLLVTGYMMMWSALSFFVPTKRRMSYIIILSLSLPLLYFGFTPPDESYDLSRYYIVLDIMKNIKLDDLFSGSSSLLYVYTFLGNTGFVSMIYFWIISLFGKKELLTYITGVIVYFVCLYFAYIVSRKYSLSKEKFAIIISYILFVFNYGEITGVRNAIAFALAAFVLYKDLVENKNKICCITLLILLSMVHNSVFLILLLRVLLLLRKVMSFRLVSILCLLAYPCIDLVQKFLEKFSWLLIINSLVKKIEGYSMRVEYNYRLVFGSMIIIVFVLIIAKYTIKNEKIYFGKYYEFTICLAAMTIGGIGTDVLFARLSNLLFFMSIPYVVYILKSLVKNSVLVWRVKNNNQKILGLLSVSGLYAVTVFFAVFNCYYLYMETFDYFFK